MRIYHATCLALIIIGISIITGCASEQPKTLVGNEVLKVTMLDPDGTPMSNLEVDVWTAAKTSGPPDAGFTMTDNNGVATFNIPDGSYAIGFNANNFPSTLVYPEKTPIIVEKGVENNKVINLVAK